MLHRLSVCLLVAAVAQAQTLTDPLLTPARPGEPVADMVRASSGAQVGNTNQGVTAALSGRFGMVAFPEQVGLAASGDEGTMDIYVRLTRNGGREWEPALRVNGDPPHTSASTAPQCAIGRSPSGEVTYVVAWEDSRLQASPTGTSARDDVFIATSTAGGPFVEIGCVSNGCGSALREIDEIAIAADGSLVCVVWEEDGVNPGCSGGGEAVHAAVSTDGGITFGAPIEVSDQLTLPASCLSSDTDNTQIAVSGDSIYIAYHSDNSTTGNNLELAISQDAGQTWSTVQPETQHLTDAGETSNTPTILVRRSPFADGPVIGAPDTVCVLTEDDVPGATNDGIIALTSFDGGLTWLPEVQVFLPAPGAGVEYMNAFLDGDTIHLAFCSDNDAASPSNGGDSATRELFYARSPDLGLTWTVPLNLEPGQVVQECQIVAFNGNVYIQAQDGPSGSGWLVHWVSTDDGATWKKYRDATSDQVPDADAGDEGAGRRIACDPRNMRVIGAIRYDQPTGANETFVYGASFPFFGTTPGIAGLDTDPVDTVFLDGLGNKAGDVLFAGLVLSELPPLAPGVLIDEAPLFLDATQNTVDCLPGGIFAPFASVDASGTIGFAEASLAIPSSLLPLGWTGQAVLFRPAGVNLGEVQAF